MSVRKNHFAHLPQRWQACLLAFIARPASHHTQEDYRTYLASLFSKKAPDAITSQDVEQYATAPSRRGPHASKGLRKQRIQIPSMFYDFARKYISDGESQPITTINPAKECFVLIWPNGFDRVKPAPFYERFSPEWKAATLAFIDSIFDISGSEQSRASYMLILRGFFEMFPDVSPADITRAEVLAFVNRSSMRYQDRGQPTSAATKNHKLSTIVSYYKWASTYLVDGQPLYQKALPTVGLRYGKVGSNGRALSDDETKRFFAAFDRATVKGKRDFCIFWLYWITGRRRLEISKLLWGDLQQTTFVDDTGAIRSGWTYEYRAKGNQRQRRTRELPASCVSLILDYLQASGRMPTMQPDSPLFIAMHPGRGRRNGATNEPMSPVFIYQLFKGYLDLAGIDRTKYTLHSLRHSSAHVRYTLTRDVRKVSEHLGHSNIGTTDKYIKQLLTAQDDDSRLVESKYADMLAGKQPVEPQYGSVHIHVAHLFEEAK